MNIKLTALMLLLTSATALYLIYIKPSAIIKKCYTETYERTNLDNSEWANEKIWTYSRNGSAGENGWGWHYPDEPKYYSDREIEKYNKNRDDEYKKCLIKNGYRN